MVSKNVKSSLGIPKLNFFIKKEGRPVQHWLEPNMGLVCFCHLHHWSMCVQLVYWLLKGNVKNQMECMSFILHIPIQWGQIRELCNKWWMKTEKSSNYPLFCPSQIKICNMPKCAWKMKIARIARNLRSKSFIHLCVGELVLVISDFNLENSSCILLARELVSKLMSFNFLVDLCIWSVVVNMASWPSCGP